MSVLINMEMPTSCLVCGFMINCDDCEGHECCCSALDRSIGYMPYNMGSFRRKDIPVVPSDYRLEDCPLIPVPDHGRLIDADELMVRVDMHGTNKFGMLDEDIRMFICDAPTIIPAEEGET